MRVMARLQRYAGLYIYRIGVRPLIRHPPEPNLPSGISLRVVQREELLKAAGDPELDMPPDFVRGALARGDMAFGAFEGDRLVGYSWRTFTAAPHTEDLWIRVDRPHFGGYKAFTRPSYRGKRIHPAIALFSDAYLLERGYTAEVGVVDISNFSSLGTARFLGRQRIGFAGYVKWFGHYVQFRTSAVRKIGFEFFKPHQ
jgi:GNAT superfamily N-acetyltransferase